MLGEKASVIGETPLSKLLDQSALQHFSNPSKVVPHTLHSAQGSHSVFIMGSHLASKVDKMTRPGRAP